MKTLHNTLVLGAGLLALAAARPASAMDMSGMQMQTTPAPAAAASSAATGAASGSAQDTGPRRADAYSDGYTMHSGPYIPAGIGVMHMDDHPFGALIVDRLERNWTRDGASTAYDLQGWWGRDFDRLMLKAEGSAAQNRIQDARTEVLWNHAVAAFWDTQLGLRHDNGGGPDRNWLAFGVQGLAPYWFNVELTGYVGDQGRGALRTSVSYDLLITQRLVLQPRVDAEAYTRADPARGVGSGLADASASVRLRYEVTRQFAPYVGLSWSSSFGGTADLARVAGQPVRQTALVAGVRMWF